VTSSDAGTHDELAGILGNLTPIVVEEARHNPGFAARLRNVLYLGGAGQAEAAPLANAVPARTRSRRTRRAPGPWDPYAAYVEVGEAGLRERLSQLALEQLRDIIAEHGMNNDGLAMKWKKVDRLVGRIVERVVDRAAKGDAFRSA
jgi:hypothetical protein